MKKRNRLAVLMAVVLLSLPACQAQKPQADISSANKTHAATATEPTALPQPTLTMMAEKPIDETPGVGSSLSFEQHGIKVSITHLVTSPTETVIDFIAEIDPEWGFTFEQYDNPPQQTYAYKPAKLMDETGRIYEPKAYHGSDTRSIDPVTGKAIQGGELIFEPVMGQILNIEIYLELMTVRSSEQIVLLPKTPTNMEEIAIASPMRFGELSIPVKSATWKPEGSFSVSMDGSIQQEDLRPICLYLFVDSQNVAAGDSCSYNDEVTDLQDEAVFLYPPDFKQPVKFGAAVDVIFMKPFTFTWVRGNK